VSHSDSSNPAVFNASRLEALGRAIDERANGARRQRRPKRSRRRKIALSLVAVVVILVAAVVGDYVYLNGLVHRVDVRYETASYNNTENVLLVGSTTRCGLKTQNAAYGLCSQGVTGVNSDVVMILHLNLTTNKVSILSIPRDLFVPNARTTGANKIDAALYNGPSQLVAAIQEDFGIPINHYVELNFDTFASVVDVLGGINMYFPMEVFDAFSGLTISHPGCVHLDGFHALQVVRARHLQIRQAGYGPSRSTWPQEALSDLARIRRDHEFLKVLGSAMKAKGISNPITDQRLATAIAPYLTVDSAMSTSHILSLVEHFKGVSVGGVPQLTMPVALVQTGSYLYQGYYYGDVEFPIQQGVQQTIEKFLGVSAGTNTMDGTPLPQPSTFTVSVVNGTGVINQAATVAANLRRDGFRIRTLGSSTPFGVREETVVYHASNSAASLGAAQVVLHTITGPAVMALGPTTGGALITVRTGSDLTILPPRSAKKHTTSAGTKHISTSTTTAPVTQVTVVDPTLVKVDTSLSAPSAVTQALAPWDPRSCGPHGTPGP
jgi:LCP family protein required for cell wall assembly